MQKEEAVSEAQRVVKENIEVLEGIWSRLGIIARMVETRRGDCLLHIRDLMETMVDEELLKEQSISADIKKNESKIKTIFEELGMLSETERETITEGGNWEGETLVQKDYRLKTEVKNLDRLKMNRIKQMSNLVSKCKSLSKDLTETAHPLCATFSSSIIPSLEDIEILGFDVTKMQEEKSKRRKDFLAIRSKVAKGMHLLGESPDDTFLINILMEPEDDFLVTKENMLRLRDVQERVERTKLMKEKELEDIWKPIYGLWDLVGTPDEQRENLKKEVKGLTEKDFNLLHEELTKLKDIRKKSLGVLTEKLVQDLTLVKQESRIPTFEDEDIGEVSEERLDELAKELERSKKILEERRPVLKQLSEWESKVRRLIELDAKAKDPSRLQNRGGNLLNEEKERKTLGRLLPKVSDTLMKKVKDFEEQHGEFFINGVPVEEHRKTIMEMTELEKEQEQIIRKRKRKMETEQEMRFGSKNPNKPQANKAKRSKSAKPMEKISEITTSSSDLSTKSSVSDLKVTPWGSMRYSPNKPPSGPPTGSFKSKTRTSSVAKKNITAVGAAIKKYTSKLVNSKDKKESKTTDHLQVPGSSISFNNRKMRRRSKSESCLRQEFLARRTMENPKPGPSRLPLPSSSSANNLKTSHLKGNPGQKSRLCKKVSDSQVDSLHGSTLPGDRTELVDDVLSETVECRPIHLDNSISHSTLLNQNDFERHLVEENPPNKRSSIIASRLRR